jgi:hypothetical protein
MRFYAKLILITAAFAGLNSATARRMLGNLAFEARVGLVYAFGTKADLDRLIEDAVRMRAAREGYLETYLAQERLAQRIAMKTNSEDEEEDLSTTHPDVERLVDRTHGYAVSVDTTSDALAIRLERRR